MSNFKKSRDKKPKWRVGDRVLAEWGTLRVLYSGTVAEHRDGEYHIRFDDGEFSWVAEGRIKRLEIAIGSRLLGRFGGGREFFSATVADIRGEDLYLRYADGREEWAPVGMIAVPPEEDDPVRAVVDLMGHGEYDRAAELLNEQLDANPKDAGLLILRAETHYHLNDYEAAIDDCNQALEQRIDDETLGKALYQRACACIELKRFAEAEQDAERAVALGRKQADYYRVLGEARHGLGRRASALEAYEQALALKPRDPETLFKRGVCLSSLQRYSEVISDLSIYLEHNPNHVPALAVRGGAYYQLNLPEQGIADLDRVFSLRTRAVPSVLHHLRATMYEQMGRLEEALADLDVIAARMDRDDWQVVHANRARLLQALGRPDDAEAALQELDRLAMQHVRDIQQNGVPVTAALVMANRVLYDPGSQENSLCRVLLTFDPELGQDHERLQALAEQLAALKDTTQTEPHMQFLAELTTVETAFPVSRIRLPADFTAGAVVYVADLWVYRRSWPVLDTKLLPCVAEPGDTGRQALLPPQPTKYVFQPEVTEAQWLDLEGSNLWAVWRSMPHPEGYRGPNRKKLLLVAHLLRQVADQMTDPRLVAVIEVAEQYADGLIDHQEMWAAHERAYEVFDTIPQPHEAAEAAANVAQRFLYEQNETAEMMVNAAGARAARLAGGTGKEAKAARRLAQQAMQAQIRRLINEVHGNPFRPVALSPLWRTDAVLALAQHIYDTRDFHTMPVLADALEEAGCTNAVILDHCRDVGPHIRGCWALDLVLGNK